MVLHISEEPTIFSHKVGTILLSSNINKRETIHQDVYCWLLFNTFCDAEIHCSLQQTILNSLEPQRALTNKMIGWKWLVVAARSSMFGQDFQCLINECVNA